jgi:hypothetical protein
MSQTPDFAALLGELPAVFTAETLTSRCRVSARTLHDWIKSGLLPAPLPVKGKRRLWTASQVRNHFAQLEEGAGRAE